ILKDFSKEQDALNDFLKDINLRIQKHNSKIDNIDQTMKEIACIFWENLRWNYDSVISVFEREQTTFITKIDELKTKIKGNKEEIATESEIVSKEQKKCVNIESAISNINTSLLDLGIDNFKIVKYSENLYRIFRDGDIDNTFITLSEGEKMIISFLYFCELCKGRKSPDEVKTNKIIVIDDPISSLSHIFIFNIGQLIKRDFFNNADYEQVFLLTHSLYFFYEMTDVNHERRKKSQKLFRLIKNTQGSQITNMKYEEIQNDYHSYWAIVKDETQPPALLANCMRNIIEYFFNFVEKQDLSNVFQKKELIGTKHQSLYRYINRESHSLGQNIFDFKEFNYGNFREALGMVFEANGYKAHYEKMIKL
ncbi:AAA family ATPase, partial [bacterium]|nr:AAA family ATPase [bacterium]